MSFVFHSGYLRYAAVGSAPGLSIDLLLLLTRYGPWFLVPSRPLQTEKREWDLRMARLQREADRLRGILWSHGINPISNVAGSNTNTNPAAANNAITQSLAPTVSHRGHKNPLGRRGGNQHLNKHRQKKKLAPLSHLGGGSSSSVFGDGNNSSTASAVIGFRNRVGDLDAQAPRGWRHT